MLPAEPLSLTGGWRCRACGVQVPAERATLLQSVLGGLLRTLYLDPALPPSPESILDFLTRNQHLLPATNHITVELKMGVVWALGHKPGLTFTGKTRCCSGRATEGPVRGRQARPGVRKTVAEWSHKT